MIGRALISIVIYVVAMIGSPELYADPYMAWHLGLSRWPDTSNRYQLEASSSWLHPTLGAAAGHHFPELSGRFGVSSEIQIEAQLPNTHGWNKNDGAINLSYNHRMVVLLGTINVWPEVKLGDSWTAYAGGGVGSAGLFLDGDRAATVTAKIGTGVRLRATRNLALDAAYRYTWTAPTDLVESRVEYKSHAFQLGFRWRFNTR